MPVSEVSNSSNYQNIKNRIEEMNKAKKTDDAKKTDNTTGTQTQKKDKTSMGKDDFLKLLVTQLTYQDPMSPMDSSEMMNQMAMLGLMEQTTNMRTALDELSKNMELSKWQQGSNLIGKTVDAVNGEGKAVSGVVEEVVNYEGKMYVLTKKDTFQIGQIVSLRDPSVTGDNKDNTQKPTDKPTDTTQKVEAVKPEEKVSNESGKASVDNQNAYKSVSNYLNAN